METPKELKKSLHEPTLFGQNDSVLLIIVVETPATLAPTTTFAIPTTTSAAPGRS